MVREVTRGVQPLCFGTKAACDKLEFTELKCTLSAFNIAHLETFKWRQAKVDNLHLMKVNPLIKSE